MSLRRRHGAPKLDPPRRKEEAAHRSEPTSEPAMTVTVSRAGCSAHRSQGKPWRNILAASGRRPRACGEHDRVAMIHCQPLGHAHQCMLGRVFSCGLAGRIVVSRYGPVLRGLICMAVLR